jgi:hypothetical protein
VRPVRALVLSVLVGLGIAACDVLPSAPAGPVEGPVQGPVGGPHFVCQGVPQEDCRRAVGATDSVKVPVQVIVRCTVRLCVPAQGEAEVTFRFADGSSEVAGYGWEMMR